MSIVTTPGCTETFKIKELIEMAEKYPKETITSIMSDFLWLLGYAQGMKEGYELQQSLTKNKGVDDNEI